MTLKPAMSSGMNLVNFNMTITLTRRQRSQHFEGLAQELLLICSMLTGAWRIYLRFRLSKSRSNRMQTEHHKKHKKRAKTHVCHSASQAARGWLCFFFATPDALRLGRGGASPCPQRKCHRLRPSLIKDSMTNESMQGHTRVSRCFWTI